MIIRIVKMTFHSEKLDVFRSIFEETKDQIRSFDGCQHLELWQDTTDPRIFFTYSIWEKQVYLDAYRKSDLFKQTWRETKALFADKPEAWSVEQKSLTT